jgi:hypothetical protein
MLSLMDLLFTWANTPFKLFANDFISVKSVQPKFESFMFLRLNDDHAKINKKLFDSLL